MPHRRLAVLLSATIIVGLAAWYGVAAAHDGAPGPPSSSIGVLLDRPLPVTIASLPLLDQTGHQVTLSQYRGRAVLLAPFLTSCQEECPITTGALLEVQQAIVAAGLANKVVILEATVDPGRDSPERMAAFARLTGSDWPLLTSSSANLAVLWHYFSVYYQKVPEGSPPGIDWQTHEPYTYDVNHTDGFVLLDADMRERFIAGGMTRIGSIDAKLRGLLDAQGQADLRNPGGGTWTVTDALNAIGWVLGRTIPPAS